jgi:hypothetical protein
LWIGALCPLNAARPGLRNHRRKFAGNDATMRTARERAHGMIAKLLVQNLIWIVVMGALTTPHECAIV